MISQFIEEVKKIESSVNALHSETLKVMQNAESRKQALAANHDAYEKKYKYALHDIADLKRRYQNEIKENHNTIAKLHSMVDMLPQKLVDENKPENVVCPASIDIEYIGQLFQNINTDTLSSAVKRQFKLGGHYAYKDMIKDFLRLAAEAELFILNNIQILTNELTKEVSLRTKCAEDEYSVNKKAHSQLALRQQQEDSAEMSELIKKRKEFFESDLIAGYEKRMATALADLGVYDKEWVSYNSKRKRNYNVAIGRLIVPFITESKSLQKELNNSIPSFSRTGYFSLPLIQNLIEASLLFFSYNDGEDGNRDEVISQIQLIILRLLRSAPADTFDLYFIDPVGRGKNLGVLNGDFATNSKININTYNAEDKISNLLEELEEEVDAVSAKIGSYHTLQEYNQKGTIPLKEKIVVIFDFPENFDEYEILRLKTVVTNAKRCGIHIIIASSYHMVYMKRSFEDYDLSFFTYKDWLFFNCKKQDEYRLLFDNGGESENYEYQAEQLNGSHKGFMDVYRKLYADGLIIDNHFANLIDINKPLVYKDSTDGLRLPVMIRNAKNGGVCELVIGTSTSTHTLITGNTSSGKSTFLHMIITSVLLNYHPDDVELWLIDYGRVEFNRYYHESPPHLRFISLEKSAEFTYSFLSYLKEYFSKREKLFAEAQVADIKGYRNKFGKLSMPRVLLIIDEFHNMTQHVQQNISYREILENSLAEYRKFGLSCIFSNQTVSGLHGLTETAKLQIKNRIALANELAEMKQTLNVAQDNYSSEMLHKMERTSVGELWYKEWITVSDFSINQFKGIYIKDAERDAVLHKIIQQNGTVNFDTEIVKINSSQRSVIPISDIANGIQKLKEERRFPMFIGSPVTIDKMFSFILERRYNNNILMVGKDTKLKRDMIATLILNASISKDFEIFAYADGADDLFCSLKAANYLSSKTCQLHIYDDTSKMCYSINHLYQKIQKKEVQNKKVLILWFGLPDIFDEFKVSPAKQSIAFGESQSADSNAIHIDDIQAVESDPEMIEMAKGIGISVKELLLNLASEARSRGKDTSTDYSYNACDDVIQIFNLGGKFNIYNVVAIDSGYDLKRLRGVHNESFIHKIVLNISKDELFDLSIKNFSIEVDEGLSAIYTDGTGQHKFRPYLIKEDV